MTRSESLSVTVSYRKAGAAAGSDQSHTVVWLRGEHDISTSTSLSGVLARVMALDKADLMVDLSEVSFMGAATVSIFVRAREFLATRSRALTLRSPSVSALRILGLCGLAELIDPPPGDAVRMTAVAGALRTWVAVPPDERVSVEPDESREASEIPVSVAPTLKIHANLASASVSPTDRAGSGKD